VSDKLLNWKFVDEFRVERPDIAAARMHSLELGIEPVSPAVGAQLAFVAAATAAGSIIEVGTGLGVSALWLLSGAPAATLTTIDSELDYQHVARGFLLEAGVPANRIRMIGGRAAEVLPRMNEASYDLVFIDGDPGSVLEYVEHGLRLARPGGTVLVAHALWRDRVADPAQRDDIVADYRMLLKEIAASEAVVASLSPAGDGLLQLVRLA
jgi:predicted O-methyltransferase YrrM